MKWIKHETVEFNGNNIIKKMIFKQKIYFFSLNKSEMN